MDNFVEKVANDCAKCRYVKFWPQLGRPKGIYRRNREDEKSANIDETEDGLREQKETNAVKCRIDIADKQNPE